MRGYFTTYKKNGMLHPKSYKLWSWAQDIHVSDIGDTTSNVAESSNARLNRNVSTSYQKFSTTANHIWSSHKKVLNKYMKQIKRGAGGRRRNPEIEEEWSRKNSLIEAFEMLCEKDQKETLFSFLTELSDPNPEDPLESDSDCDSGSDET